MHNMYTNNNNIIPPKIPTAPTATTITMVIINNKAECIKHYECVITDIFYNFTVGPLKYEQSKTTA